MINLIFFQALVSCPADKSAYDCSTILPLIVSEAILVPDDFVVRVYPNDLLSKGTGALKLYHSFLERGSITLFFKPFFPFESPLFFP